MIDQDILDQLAAKHPPLTSNASLGYVISPNIAPGQLIKSIVDPFWNVRADWMPRLLHLAAQR